MRRALILGGTGLVGRAIALRLAARRVARGRDRPRRRQHAGRPARGRRRVHASRQPRRVPGRGGIRLRGGSAGGLRDVHRRGRSPAVAARAQCDLDGDDLEQGRLRRRRRQPLELRRPASLRRADSRDAADARPAGHRLPLARGLRREQGRGRAGHARQRAARLDPAAVEDPRARRRETARMDVRQARARPAAGGDPRAPRRRRRPHDRGREHRRARRGGRGRAGGADPEQRRPGRAERSRDRPRDRACALLRLAGGAARR